MTARADSIRIAVIRREPGMVKCCTRPGGGRVTRFARCWEFRRSMTRVVRAVIVRCMTRITSCVRKLVIPAGMARLARRRRVHSRQGEFGRAVVERCRLPRGRRMARLTVLTEVARNVIRIRRTGEIGAVALITV